MATFWRCEPHRTTMALSEQCPECEKMEVNTNRVKISLKKSGGRLTVFTKTPKGIPLNLNASQEAIVQLYEENEELKAKLAGRLKNKDGEYDPLLVELWYLKKLEKQNKKLMGWGSEYLLTHKNSYFQKKFDELLKGAK